MDKKESEKIRELICKIDHELNMNPLRDVMLARELLKRNDFRYDFEKEIRALDYIIGV